MELVCSIQDGCLRILCQFLTVSGGKVKEKVGSCGNNPVIFRSGIRYTCSMDFRCFPYQKWFEVFRFRWYSVGIRLSSQRNPARIWWCSALIPGSGFVGNRQDPVGGFPARITASIFRVFFRPVPVGNTREPAGIDGNKPGFP